MEELRKALQVEDDKTYQRRWADWMQYGKEQVFEEWILKNHFSVLVKCENDKLHTNIEKLNELAPSLGQKCGTRFMGIRFLEEKDIINYKDTPEATYLRLTYSIAGTQHTSIAPFLSESFTDIDK